MEADPLKNARQETRELRERVRDHYEEEVDLTHRSLIRAWAAFGITFGLTRGWTYAIREQWIPNVNIATDNLHIHHFVWGIGLLLLVGYLLFVDDKARHHGALAIAYGVGAALIIDEFALLLNLRDVYFAEEGRWSVDIALGIIAVVGVYVAGRRFWHSAFHEVGALIRRVVRR